MSGYKVDPFCYLAAILFCGSGIIRTVLFDIPLSTKPFDFGKWTDLEGDYLKEQWLNMRTMVNDLWITYTIMHVLAWILVATILFRYAWIQSANGTIKIGVNVGIAFVAATTAIVELIVRMLFHGSIHAQDWIAKDFTLEEWAVMDVDTDEFDHLGWKTLEVVSIASTGFLIWADTIEYMALVVILVLVHNASTVAGSLFSKNWAFFGVLIACLQIFDIAAEILRFFDWMLFGHIAMYISSANQIFIFPLWLIWMGAQLSNVPKFMNNNNIPDDLQLH